MGKVDLKVGDVFLSINPELSGDSPHYHIVVLKTDDEQVLVVHTTKQVDKTRESCQRKEQIKFPHIDPGTMVIINNNHCLSLKIDSAIDCNKAQLKPQIFFTEKQYFRMCSPIKDKKTIELIRNAIKQSRIVPDSIVNLL